LHARKAERQSKEGTAPVMTPPMMTQDYEDFYVTVATTLPVLMLAVSFACVQAIVDMYRTKEGARRHTRFTGSKRLMGAIAGTFIVVMALDIVCEGLAISAIHYANDHGTDLNVFLLVVLLVTMFLVAIGIAARIVAVMRVGSSLPETSVEQ
jgi:MFS family permease